MESCYAEVADLSQAHTLAYIFAESFKALRNVRVVEVRNEGCFEEGGWRVLYRSLVLRMWRWGGGVCGLRFEEGGEGEKWFRLYFKQSREERCGEEVGEELYRLAGGDMPDLITAGVGP